MSHIKRLIVLILLGLISTAGASTEKYRLIWNSSPESSMTVAWCQTDGENPQVLYKEWSPEAGNAPLQTHGVDHETSYLTLNSKFARLTGLKPNTAYRFLIRDSNSEGPKFWFKTAPAGEGSFSFAAGGDSRNHRDARQRANRTAAKLRPLFICFGGDMISSPTTKSWSEWLDDWQLTTGKDDDLAWLCLNQRCLEVSFEILSRLDVNNVGVDRAVAVAIAIATVGAAP